jgi:hypothetical protein
MTTIQKDVMVRPTTTVSPLEWNPSLHSSELNRFVFASFFGDEIKFERHPDNVQPDRKISKSILDDGQWLESVALDLKAKEPIEIIVQYVNEKDQQNGNRIWAIQSSLKPACNNLFRIINNYCVKNKDKLVQANEINVNDVFAAMYQGNTYYRVQILEIMDPGLTQVCYLMVLFCFFSFCNFGFFSSYIRYVFV